MNQETNPVCFHRRYDGISNNMKYPLRGAAMQDLTRDLPSAYGDGIATPAGSCTTNQKQRGVCPYPHELNGLGSHRPSPRKISNVLFAQV